MLFLCILETTVGICNANGHDILLKASGRISTGCVTKQSVQCCSSNSNRSARHEWSWIRGIMDGGPLLQSVPFESRSVCVCVCVCVYLPREMVVRLLPKYETFSVSSCSKLVLVFPEREPWMRAMIIHHFSSILFASIL
jgi:hypothetical protein